MLQRAASNAYSWWWASHIRTKQSKWLEQSLHDMEEKVQGMIKLIEEDGDSFAKRAEMYYKRRPELINSVEEAYKAFRSLADRYDMLSKEFQTANHTIATIFPEQVPYNMDQDDESHPPKVPKNIPPPVNMDSIPKTPPNAPFKDLKRLITKASKELKDKKLSKDENSNKVVVKSGLTKDEALEEIDKLHKDILALQTVKEFVKSSYESGLAKYWGIENQITEMQQKVCRLQDEFNVDTVIEDDEARALMADAALKSCQEILTQLQEKQERSERVAKEEYDKIESARVILESLRNKYLHEEKQIQEEKTVIKETEPLEEKPTEILDSSLTGSLTVTQLAEKIDNLVNKVISLETAVSSQTVLINTLRTESDDLHGQIQDLENEKDSLINDTQNLSTVVKEMEVKLTKIQDLTKNVERQNSNLQTNFAEARTSLDHLSERVSCVKPDEEIEETEEPVVDVKEVDVNVEKTPKKSHVMFLGQKLKKAIPMARSHKSVKSESDVDLSWQQMLLSGVDDREKILLKEYTEILRNYKDVKKKLSDMEKKDRDSQFDIVLKMREQKKAILKRDEEIQNLRKKLSLDLDEDRGLIPDEEIEIVEVNKVDEENYDIPITIIEQKFRKDIDAILDENLEFWLRFSTVFHQIKKFKTEVSDLQNEIEKLEDKKEQGHVTSEMKSEARSLYKHLREIQTELTVWLEQSVPLKEEIKSRFALLCGIQEEITKAMNEGDEEDEKGFNSHKAAIFQGEILNMKQENNKVKEELQGGFDHVSLLQLEIEKTLMKLSEEYGISSDQPELKDAMSRSKIPLRSFIFGRKMKKARSSIFSRYHILRAALPSSKHS